VREIQIPLYDVKISPRIIDDVTEVLLSGQLAGGPKVAEFEDKFGKYIGNHQVTSTGDISTSLTMCLYLAGVKPGDEVIVSPMVCLATSCPIANLFAKIIWCDIDPLTGNIDPNKLTPLISSKTKAIIVYHWAGNPAELNAIHSIAKDYGIAVIEDAGEALGAGYEGEKIGATGSDFTVFSFYANRHITTIDGGAIAFSNADMYEKGKWLKRYGIHQPSFRDDDGEINPDSDVIEAGWNSYMNNISATIGVSQMDVLPAIVSRYQSNGKFYDENLMGVPGVTPLKRPQNSLSAYWVYTFLAEDRDNMIIELKSRGIQASKVHYRNDKYGFASSSQILLPGVDSFARSCLSIPCGPWVSDADREFIVSVILSYCKE
jgi:perosamine synthetase